MKHGILAILISCYFSVLSGNISDYRFSQLPIEGSRSTHTILSLMQDSQGFIWAGTSEGVYKYDGYRFYHYRNSPGDSSSITHNFVFSITEDQQGNIWLGTRQGLNMITRSSNTVIRIIDDQDKTRIPSSEIYAVKCDSHNNIWIGTNGSGLLRIRNGEIDFEKIALSSENTEGDPDKIRTIMEDSKGNIWLGTRNFGVYKLNPATGDIINYRHNPENLFSISDNYIRSIEEDGQGNIWIGTENKGINLLAHASSEFVNANNNPDFEVLRNEMVRSILSRNADEIWIGSRNGLYIYQTSSGKIFSFSKDDSPRSKLSNNSIRALTMDSQGNIWIGSYFGGIDIFFESMSHFRYLPSGKKHNVVEHISMVSSAIEVGEELWVATGNHGIVVFDKDKKMKGSLLEGPEFLMIKTLLSDHQGNVWIGTYGSGLYRYELQTKKIISYKNQIGNPLSRLYNDINVLFIDSEKQLWIGTNTGGLHKYLPGSDSFERISRQNDYVDIRGNNINTITELDKERLCFGTNLGISIYNAMENTLSEISVVKGQEGIGLSYNMVSSVLLQDEFLWIGTTGGGLNRLDMKTGVTRFFDKEEGLSNGVIRGIESDSNGQLWISTNNGIFLFKQEDESFIQFDAAEGLNIESFYPGSHYQDAQGNIFFGGFDGLIWFDPADIRINTFQAPVVITSIKEFNDPLNSRYINYKGTGPSDISLKLPYDIRGLTFDFACLNYLAPQKNTYAYQLENYFEEWIDLGTRHSLTFSTLPPGSYTLNIKAANNHNVWNDNGISIPLTIHPPIWKTWYAYVIYTLLILILLYSFRMVTLSWARIRHQLATEKLKAENQEELNQLKLNFFTNVSHEFRTPLTLIINTAESLKTRLSKSEDLAMVKTLSKNSERLLQLMLELMEFRKAKSGVMKFKPACWDIILFLGELTEDFRAYAACKNIRLEVESSVDSLDLYFDPSKMEKIYVNLLSNAIKHCEAFVKIRLSLKEDYFQIEVSNDGDGIPLLDQKYIFNRFYRANPEKSNSEGYSEGSGIGLALTKELVELHKGSIRLDTSNDELTIFIVELPLGEHIPAGELSDLKQEEWTRKEKYIPAVTESLTELSKEEKEIAYLNKENLVLVVEDNQELREYLADQLKDTYEILSAKDGQEGVESAKERIPDLIISDIMMPRLDGITLCEMLKNDIPTSHIPIILLTAKGSDESKIQGYKTGADLYVQKPFNINILRAQMEGLLESRKRLRKKFAGMNMVDTNSLTSNHYDSKFLEKTIALVEEHMEQPDFDILCLCQKSGMSRSVFYRKVKAITDLQPQEFIKNLRLRKAALLLKEENMGISEVATEVGFINAKHFSTSFKKLYKISPSEYRKGH